MTIRRYFVLGLAWFSMVPWTVSQNVRSINKVPGQIESSAQRLTHKLVVQGFEVSRGYFKLYTIDECQYTFDIVGSCFANNPAAPYITFAVPPWPEEAVTSISTLLGPSPAGYIDVHRFDPREAIVILAQMPPPARYFGEQSYVFTRQGSYDTSSDIYKNLASNLPPFILPLFFTDVPNIDPQRIFLFASLSNPINNVVIQNQSDAAFDQRRYFILTPDDFMNKAVREALAGISIADKDVFTEKIPSNLNFGLDQASDDFLTVMRYAQPNDQGGVGSRSDTWRKDLPLVVMRVRDTRHTPEPYPEVVLEDRTAFDERPLNADLMNLVSAVHRRWTGQPCAKADCSDVGMRFLDYQGYPFYAVGPLCVPIGEDCLGDNWDASYKFYGRLSVDQGEIYAIAGTLGTRTGNATYVGLSINKVSQFLGVANISDGLLDGTAAGYAGEVNNADHFFLYYLARNCSGLKELTGDHCFEVDETMIPKGDFITLGLRDYILPGSQRGPDSTKILPPMVFRVR